MKLRITTIITILFFSNFVMAQWVQRAAFPGVSRAKAASFTIGNKIYVIGGISNSVVVLRDFWEYDITTNSWSQKANFPGEERYGAATFVLNGRGYIATGGNDFGFLDDLWEFNPLTDTWAQRNGLPAGSAQHENQRREAFAFTIGNKAYLGGGDGFVFGANQTWNYAFFDLWEYNPNTNNWIPKSSIPDAIGRNMSIGVAVNNKGYVGMGCNVDQNINRTSFWEYEPVADNWTAKSDFPNNFTTDASTFVLDTTLYLIGGVNLNPVALSNQFYKYEPFSDTWTQLPDFSGGAIAGAICGTNGITAFVGTGYNASVVTRSDLWEIASIQTGIDGNQIAIDNKAILYPNPMRDRVSIQSEEEIGSVKFYDVSGKLVLMEEENFENINVQNLNPGIYHLSLKYKNGIVVNKQIVKLN